MFEISEQLYLNEINILVWFSNADLFSITRQQQGPLGGNQYCNDVPEVSQCLQTNWKEKRTQKSQTKNNLGGPRNWWTFYLRLKL